MYPVRPVNAPIPGTDEVGGTGMEISVGISVCREKMANSVVEYPKHTVSWFKNEITRGECGKGASWKEVNGDI
jgi:hypothetical protein